MKKSTDLSPSPSEFWRPLASRNFRFLFIGESVSYFGDQFCLVALPWLTIQLTGSPLDLGAVLMSIAIPRAILMLIGGALSDLLSPRLVMLLSNVCRIVLTAILAILVLSQTTQLWQLYLLAFSFGIMEGLFTPAAEAILPTLVTESQLTASNILTQGTNQLIMLIGPALAGLTISATGVGTAFVVDAGSFVVSTIALISIGANASAPNTTLGGGGKPPPNFSDRQGGIPMLKQLVMTGVQEGLNYAWHNFSLRTVLLILTVFNFLFMGSLQVGIISLAYNHFTSGALAVGMMNSAWGGGGLLGILLPQIITKLPSLGTLMLVLGSLQGGGMVLLSLMPTLPIASLMIALLGCCSSFFVLVAIIWVQKSTPPGILGRVMGLAMLSSMGIAPFSYAVAGLVADWSLPVLFRGAGLGMLIFTAFLAVKPSIRAID
jgi:MFS family permease